ncbi:hypothetical protein, partial [Sphingomonas panaciterrae]|uniref:hypothetical protein n=1 Tax=Sphingomonas panaciterrae TaxID=1462999 RepID=UPI002FF24059
GHSFMRRSPAAKRPISVIRPIDRQSRNLPSIQQRSIGAIWVGSGTAAFGRSIAKAAVRSDWKAKVPYASEQGLRPARFEAD